MSTKEGPKDPNYGLNGVNLDVKVTSKAATNQPDHSDLSQIRMEAEIVRLASREADPTGLPAVVDTRTPDQIARAEVQEFLARGEFGNMVNFQGAGFKELLRAVQGWPAGSFRDKSGNDVLEATRLNLDYMAKSPRPSGDLPLNQFTSVGGLQESVRALLLQEAAIKRSYEKAARLSAEQATRVETAVHDLALVIGNFKKQDKFNENEKPGELEKYMMALRRVVGEYNIAKGLKEPGLDVQSGKIPERTVHTQINFSLTKKIEVPGLVFGIGTRKKDKVFPLILKVISHAPRGYLSVNFDADREVLRQAGIENI